MRRTFLECPAGESFGSVELPESIRADTVFYVKKCRNQRCAEPDRVIFHRFDAVTGACETFSRPKANVAEIRAFIQEANHDGRNRFR